MLYNITSKMLAQYQHTVKQSVYLSIHCIAQH